MLSKIEYLIKFGQFLTLQSSEIMFRVNFILDIAPLEDSNAVSVARPGKKMQKRINENKIPKMSNETTNFVETQYTQDKYEYGMQKKIKKRKYNDFFAERKAENDTNKFEETKVES